MIYLDHAAATPVDPRVLEAMSPYFIENYGNPSSLHSLGRKARCAVDDARSFFAEKLGCDARNIIFTSGGTESCNLALRGIVSAEKNKLIVSKIEHSAVIETAKSLAAEGVEVVYLSVDSNGFVDLEELESLIDDQTALVSVGYANNEIGVVQDLVAISKICRAKGVLLHTDACQAAGFFDLDMVKLGVDLVTINASKIYGPKGIGLLAVNKNIVLKPLLMGGGQEFGVRSGTENVPAIVGFKTAYELVLANMEQENRRLLGLRELLISSLLERIDDCEITGDRDKRLPNHVSLIVAGIEGESMLIRLDQEGVAVSTGSACSSGSLEPSHVLKAIGMAKSDMFSSLRISLGRNNDIEQVKSAIEIIVNVVRDLREIGEGFF